MPSPLTLPGVPVAIDTNDGAQARAAERLLYHRGVLEAHGVNDLAALGALQVSGAVVPQPGLTIPAAQLLAAPTMFQAASSVATPADAQTRILVPAGGEAALVNVVEPPVAAFAGAPEDALDGAVIPVDTAYWAASWIDLADGTTVVFKQPHRWLVLIAERITVGRDVTFTWERPAPIELPATLPKPGKPQRAPTPNGLWGVTGDPGTSGVAGGRGPDGVDAPEVELWALAMSGHPAFDLRGQDGFRGGQGQDGGDGGDGSTGRAEQYGFLGFCSSGPGNGGDGGPGGNSGPGGPGGNGGHGGRLSFYAPQPVLAEYAREFFITVDGGTGAAGGLPGTPGAGGSGGQVGDSPRNCAPSTPRYAGAPGPQGGRAGEGPAGQNGGRHGDAIQFTPISADDFRERLTAPAVITLSPSRAAAGETVSVLGQRFVHDDVVVVDGAPVAAQVISDTLLTFAVPNAPGGYRSVQVRQADGTESNRGTLYVLPVLRGSSPGGRVRPGTTVTLTGTGLAPGCLVRVNGQDMQAVAFVDPGTVAFTLTRPATVERSARGEPVSVHVVLADGTPSNEIEMVLDTFRMLVLGDSVHWGQGLREHEKTHSLVEQAMAARNGGLGVYKDVLAHSGAVIGIADATTMDAIDGEVPTSYPTVLQQCDAFADDPSSVDLILVNGGLNDVNFRRVINPTVAPADFVDDVDQRCEADMATLLDRIARKFDSATIVVTGYYPIVSDESDLAFVEALLTAVGVGLAGLAGLGIVGAKPAIARNCRVFAERSTAALQAAVDEANDGLPGEPRIVYADAGFGPQNAVFASDPWLFGVNLDLSPQDNLVAGSRAVACELNASRSDVEVCKRASVGHPNVTGASRYATAILAALDARGHDPFRELPPFPDSFLWGVATAAMQVEGGIENNDWHAFTTSPAIARRVEKLSGHAGRPVELSPAGEAVRHGDLDVLRADLDRARALGIDTYRLSLEWARIQPAPPSAADQPELDAGALAYYDQVFAELAERDMTPVVTLSHLSLPLWVLNPPRESSILSAIGIPTAVPDGDFEASLRGWENEATVERFVTFCRLMAERYKDRVRWWITVNEPVGSQVGVGYIAGIWPPGFTGDGDRARAAHLNLIKAHARAYEAIKEEQPDARVGFAHAMLHAKTTSAAALPGGVEVAARNQFDYFYNWHFLEAVVNGTVDVAIQRRPANQQILDGPERAAFFGFPIDDQHPWRPRLDFVGVNFYRSVYVYYDQLVSLSAGFSGGAFVNDLAGGDQPHTLLNDLGWEINPDGLGQILDELHQRYALPVLITENGMPERADRNRAAYVVSHLRELLEARARGVDVLGYLHWTIVDNWEWHEGYRPEARFGLFTVDRDAPGMPRHMTEGAMALRHAIAAGELESVADRFGWITPGGERVRPPRVSPGMTLQGTIGGAEPFTVHLSALRSGALTGMLFEHESGRWMALEQVQWLQNEGILRFSVRPGGGRLRTFEALATQAGLQGQVNEDGQSRSFAAARIPEAGLWIADRWLKRVVLRWTEAPGGLTGKSLSPRTPIAWQALTAVTSEGATLSFGDGERTFTGSVDGTTLRGVVRDAVNPAGEPWQAQRAPDGLPFPEVQALNGRPPRIDGRPVIGHPLPWPPARPARVVGRS